MAPVAGWRWLLRQGVYALLLTGLVMGLASLNWLGTPALRTYVVFFLTEELDVRGTVPKIQAWAETWDMEWLPPWLRPGGEGLQGGADGGGEAGLQQPQPGTAPIEPR